MTHPDLTDSLRSAERRLQAAQLASDVDSLGALISDALLFTAPDGSLFTKEDDLGAHRTGAQRLTRMDELELRALVVGSTGVTWFLGNLEGEIGGQPFAAKMRYTRTWVRNEQGEWSIVAAHASAVS